MNTRRIALPLLLAVVLAGAAPVATSMAHPHGGCTDEGFRKCPGGYGHGHGFHMGMRSGLSPEQQEKYKAIVNEYSGKMAPLEDQIFVKRQELRALQNAATPNVDSVRAQATELRNLYRQLHTLHAEMSQKLESEAGLPGCPGGGMRKGEKK